jgi:hypothetical protein
LYVGRDKGMFGWCLAMPQLTMGKLWLP